MQISPKSQAAALLEKAQHICCIVGPNSRMDAVISALGAQHLLQKMQKEVVSVIPQEIPPFLHFLPVSKEGIQKQLQTPGELVLSLSTKNATVDRIKYAIEEEAVDIIVTPKKGKFSPEDISVKERFNHFDAILVFDVLHLESLGEIFSLSPQTFAQSPIINISTNPATELFGKINLIYPEKASCSEILFEVASGSPSLKKQIDADLATILLTGVVLSTESFLAHNTTASSLEVSGLLQEKGARHAEIIDHCFKQKSFTTLKVWGRILASLQYDPVHKFSWAEISLSDFLALEADMQHVDRISDEILRFVEESELSILFIEREDSAIAQIRSSYPHFDWEVFPKDFAITPRENGIDITIEAESFADAQSFILYEVLRIQKERLHIDESVPLQKYDLRKVLQHQKKEATFPEKKKKAVPKPMPPKHIPFEIEEDPSACKTEKPSTDNTKAPSSQEEEVVVNPKSRGIPDWLKRSFPKN